MRAVIQRVSRAAVTDEGGNPVTKIGPGLVVLLGVQDGDSKPDAVRMADRIANLRLFGDHSGRLNRSVLEVGGQVLLAPQFTLLGSCSKGRRPDFARAASPDDGRRLWEETREELGRSGVAVAMGAFREHTKIELVNDGPVTVVFDTRSEL